MPSTRSGRRVLLGINNREHELLINSTTGAKDLLDAVKVHYRVFEDVALDGVLENHGEGFV